MRQTRSCWRSSRRRLTGPRRRMRSRCVEHNSSSSACRMRCAYRMRRGRSRRVWCRLPGHPLRRAQIRNSAFRMRRDPRRHCLRLDLCRRGSLAFPSVTMKVWSASSQTWARCCMSVVWMVGRSRSWGRSSAGKPWRLQAMKRPRRPGALESLAKHSQVLL